MVWAAVEIPVPECTTRVIMLRYIFQVYKNDESTYQHPDDYWRLSDV